MTQQRLNEARFARINRGYDSVFVPNRLSVGLVVPIENYAGPVPTMRNHVERVRLAEQLGFAAVWLRDVPFNVASFGDAGQIHDPFVYLGLLAGASRQSPDWVARHGDGWMTYPRPDAAQSRQVIAQYRADVQDAGRGPLPVMQPLYVDLARGPRGAVARDPPRLPGRCRAPGRPPALPRGHRRQPRGAQPALQPVTRRGGPPEDRRATPTRLLPVRTPPCPPS